MLPNRTYSKTGFIFVSSLPMCPPGCLESFDFFRVSISSRKRRVPTDPLHSPRQAQLATLLAEAHPEVFPRLFHPFRDRGAPVEVAPHAETRAIGFFTYHHRC